MNSNLTEEEMRRALFGLAETPAPTNVPSVQEETPEIVFSLPKALPKRKNLQAFTPKLNVTLKVGNEFEGSTEILTYEADTLSKLQAELDATKMARKKFKYVEVISVKPAN
jgi:hypothetical protein